MNNCTINIQRIIRMERLFCQVLRLKSKHPRTLAEQRAMRQSLAVLASYYSSREWKEDFAADEAGLFPRSLKRGILSEDGLWNLLSGY
ncbi:MAG: DUF4298 domain-containing protein [Prevotella sp.]|nr:DUF4298 domain-containing protein [Prevotella sp.]